MALPLKPGRPSAQPVLSGPFGARMPTSLSCRAGPRRVRRECAASPRITAAQGCACGLGSFSWWLLARHLQT